MTNLLIPATRYCSIVRPAAAQPGRDERGRVAAGPALADGGSQVGRNTTAGCDREADPESAAHSLSRL
jgi:hypothetical protein